METTAPANVEVKKRVARVPRETTPDNSPIMNLEQVAEMLNVHPKTIRLMAVRGELPARQVGRLWRFSRAQIESWIHGTSAVAA